LSNSPPRKPLRRSPSAQKIRREKILANKELQGVKVHAEGLRSKLTGCEHEISVKLEELTNAARTLASLRAAFTKATTESPKGRVKRLESFRVTAEAHELKQAQNHIRDIRRALVELRRQKAYAESALTATEARLELEHLLREQVAEWTKLPKRFKTDMVDT